MGLELFEVPVACRLSDEELRNREATLLAQFKSSVVATEQLADGYAFQVPGDKKSLARVLDLILAEPCCASTKKNNSRMPCHADGNNGQLELIPAMGFSIFNYPAPIALRQFLRDRAS